MNLVDKNTELSVIVVIVSDTVGGCCNLSYLSNCLKALADQLAPPKMEIIVPYLASIEGIDSLANDYPNVIFLAVDDLKSHTGRGGSREHHDELRARGIAAASGRIIALLEDHAKPDIQWSRNIVNAHDKEYAVIGGAIENGIDRPINWAVYFCDFGKYQNPVPEGVSQSASDANVSYKGKILANISDIWQPFFNEPKVNWSIMQQGGKIALSPDIIVYQYRSGLEVDSALQERFIWGRSYAASRSAMMGRSKRYIYALITPILPIILCSRLISNVINKKRNQWAFIKSFPLIFLMTIYWAMGELTGYISHNNP